MQKVQDVKGKLSQKKETAVKLFPSISDFVVVACINYSIPHHRGKAYSINMYGFTKNSAKFPDST